MKENVGNADRLLRVGIGASLLTAGVLRLRSGKLGPSLLFASGALLLGSAIYRVCPMNSLLGIDTRKLDALGQRSSSTSSTDSEPLPSADAPVTIFPRRSE